MSVSLPPNLFKELHPVKSKNFIDGDALNATTQICWVCPMGHEWVGNVFTRMRGASCPYCSNRRVLKGFNDLATVNPRLANEWHPSKNIKNGIILSSSDIVAGGRYQAAWICAKGHEWVSDLGSRVKNDSFCPYCSNLLACSDNSLATMYPNIAKEWNPSKNGNLTANDVLPGSHFKVWWLGSCGHEWETSINKRTVRNQGCPYCSNQKVLAGFNDLATSHPQLAKEWHPKRNGDILPSMIISGGNQVKYWWKCDKGHEWETTVNKRKSGAGCHYCSGQKVLKNFNDLSSKHSKLAKEWHPTRNGDMTPDNVSKGANKKVWWLGSCGHEWEAYVRERSGSHQTGCPKFPTVVSSAEKELGSFIVSVLPENYVVEYGVKNLVARTELDIYVPDKNFAVEYNGLYWHSEKFRSDPNYHYDKFVACRDAGIQLVQVWEDDWRDRREIVQRMISAKLGVSKGRKVYARNTEIVEVSVEESNIFLDSNHIQGSVNGRVRLGLKFEGVLVAVMVMKNENGSSGEVLNLLRFASSCQVVGGFTKLLNAVQVRYPDVLSVVTFSDNMVSDGGLYRSNGFVFVKDVKPDYMYRWKNSLHHKFNFRLKGFRNNPDLKFVEGLTEFELAELNGLLKVWDAGKVKWVYMF